MTTLRVPNPGNLWSESPSAGAAIELLRLVWAFDIASDTWSLTTNALLEAGRLADVTGTGSYVLTPLASITPSMPVLRVAMRGATVITY